MTLFDCNIVVVLFVCFCTVRRPASRNAVQMSLDVGHCLAAGEMLRPRHAVTFVSSELEIGL